MAIKSRGETLTFRENNYWDFLDEDAEESAEEADVKELHDLGNEYDGGYPEDELLAEDADKVSLKHFFPKLAEAEQSKPGIAKHKIFYWFRQVPEVLGGYGDCPYLIGFGLNTKFKPIEVKDSANYSYGKLDDIVLEGNQLLVIVTLPKGDVKKYDLKSILRIASPGSAKYSAAHKILKALHWAASKAESTLTTKQVRNLRVRNALGQLSDTIASELKSHIKNIVFRIPPHSAYTDQDILEVDPEASEQQATQAAEKINKIHNDFYELPFAKQAEAAGIVEDRIPAENVGWILSSWGPVGKIYFNCAIDTLSEEAQDIIKKAKLSEQAIKPGATDVDCYRLAVELIKYFDNDPRFFDKNTTEDLQEDATTDRAAWQAKRKELLNRKVEFYYDDMDYTYVATMDEVIDALVELVTDEEVAKYSEGRFKTLDEISDYDYEQYLKNKDQKDYWQKHAYSEWTALLEKNCDELLKAHEAEVQEALRDKATEAAVEEGEASYDDGADPDGFYGWDDYYRWKNG
jgi:hypothetical protein